MTILFTNGTEDGISPNIHKSLGGQHILTVTGNFDGASVSFQVKSSDDPNSQWVENKAYTVATNDPVTFLPGGYDARAVISSAGASTDIFMEVRT